MTIYGAFNSPPSAPRGTIEHVFARSDALSWVPDALAGIRERGRTPLLTIEPWDGEGDLLRALPSLTVGGRLWLRYGHEMNGDWYPWGQRPSALRVMWRMIKATSPLVRLIWCPNAIYPGSTPLADLWPGDDVFDAIGIDAYDQINGAPPQDFRHLITPTITVIQNAIGLRGNYPLWICETATPRRHAERPVGAGQAGWINDMKHDAKRMGIDAVVWFNEDRPDGHWALGPAGTKALFGKGAGRA